MIPPKMPKQLEPLPLPYERQPNESEEAFSAFLIYRNLGLERSVAEVARQYGCNESLIRRWKYDWRWEFRARMWDNELDRELRQALVKENISAVRKMVRFGQNLTALAVIKMNEMIDEQDHAPTNEKGKKKSILSKEEMMRYADMGFKLERLGLGESTENIKLDEHERRDATTDLIINDPELTRLALQLDRELYKRKIIAPRPDDTGKPQVASGEPS